jgi:hypothetical protein
LNRRLQNDLIHKFSEEDTRLSCAGGAEGEYLSVIVDCTPEIIEQE